MFIFCESRGERGILIFDTAMVDEKNPGLSMLNLKLRLASQGLGKVLILNAFDT